MITRVGDIGQPPDHGDVPQRLRVEREEGPAVDGLVLQEDHGPAGDLAGERTMLVGEDDGGRWLGVGPPGEEAQLGAENAPGGAVDVLGRHAAVGERPGQVLGALLDEGLFHVEPRPERLGGVAQAPEEIGDGDALESPLVAEHPLEETLVLPGPFAVDRVVRRHDPVDALVDDAAEVGQEDLVQGGVVGRHVHGEARVLHGVEGVVLGRRHHVGPDAADQRRPHVPEEQRILAVGLLHPAPGRMPGQVDAHAGEEVRALGGSFEPDGGAHPLLEVAVPRRAVCHGDREGGRVPHDHPPGAVREEQPREPEALDAAHGDRRPVVAGDVHVDEPLPERGVAIEQSELLLGRQLTQELVHERPDRLAGPEAVHQEGEGGRGGRRGRGGGRHRRHVRREPRPQGASLPIGTQ